MSTKRIAPSKTTTSLAPVTVTTRAGDGGISLTFLHGSVRMGDAVAGRKLTSLSKGASYQMVVQLVQDNNLDALILCIEHGVQGRVVKALRTALGVPRSTVADLLGMSDKTAHRWDTHQRAKLPRLVSERAIHLLQLRQKAIEVFEDEADAIAWLREPNEAFGGRSPLDHARTDLGCRQIERLLTRIDHGVYS